MVIGRGAFGKVYKVKKIDTGEIYAMKTLQKDKIMKMNQQKNTQSERKILESVNHPFIVKLHFAFQTPTKLYFVMDFLNGGELFFHLRREQRFS
jgi:serine/threonine protein kinase